MQTDGSQTPEGGGEDQQATPLGLELLADLAGLHTALATANTDEEKLEAVAHHLERWRARSGSEEGASQVKGLYALADALRGANPLENMLRSLKAQLSSRGTEEALRQAQRQRILQETILDNMDVGVLLADARTGEVLRMNRGLTSLLQFDSPKSGAVDSFARRTCVPGTDTDIPKEDWPLARSLATGERVEAEHDILVPDGTRVTVSVVATPVLDEDGKMVKCLVLFSDITERTRAERERLEMQEQLIRAQAAALAERSTPLIPISKDIVVMPLIGSIDVARGQEMTSTLLEGASRARALFAILDITGARALDEQAACALLGAARALRLLGIEPVLTGVRPEVAQTLVSLGVDLGGIVTRGTLESGITYANQRLGGAGLRA